MSPASAVQAPHCQSPYGFEPSRLGGRRIKRPKTVRLIPIKSRQSGLVGKVLKPPKWSWRQILTSCCCRQHTQKLVPGGFTKSPLNHVNIRITRIGFYKIPLVGPVYPNGRIMMFVWLFGPPFTAALHRSRPRPARFSRDPKALTKTHTCKHTRDHCMFYEPLNKLLLHRGYTGIRYLGC